MLYRTTSVSGLPPFKIAVHEENDRYVSPEILHSGQWEPFETYVIMRCLEGNCDFYDVGANLGWYSVVAGLTLAANRGTVHAFEPALENAQLLLHNVQSNALSNVRINPCALGGRTGPIELRLSADNKGDHQTHDGDVHRATVSASMIRFDEYYLPSDRRIVVKLDTQGSELAIIDGMGAYLNSIERMTMLIEFWPHGLEHSPGNVERLISVLSGAGFQAYSLTEDDPHLRPAPWRLLSAAAKGRLAPGTGAFVNLLLCRNGDPALERLADLWSAEPSPHLSPS